MDDRGNVLAGVLFGRPNVCRGRPTDRAFWSGNDRCLLTSLIPALWAYNGFNDLGDLAKKYFILKKTFLSQSS